MTDWDKYLDPPDNPKDSWPECEECSGEGEVTDEAGDWVKCEACDGEGVTEPSDPREEPEYYEDR